ncbi:MAG: amino acid ABC transporter substrate-binding protein [Rhizobiales bacterium 65-9]|nr:amino acid ABC transporter substrate-binding protein [Hyphomicrobiales bacterium]OJY37908.1 MAG: amino acid ABC transporter substrate-binding protein [Rhizobiales bacterium 65-9]
MAFIERRAFLNLASAATLLFASSAAYAAETLRVGAYPSNPPWEFKNAQGEFEGFEVDMVKDIAKRLGMPLEISDLGFQALFAATSAKRIDLAISTITITKERLKSQSFTQGFYDSDGAMATQVGSRIKSLADAKGAIIGVLSSSVGEAWAKDNQAKYGFAEIKGYDTYQNLLLDLQNGRTGAVVSDFAGMSYYFQKMKGLQIAERIPSPDDRYGLMMTKDHPLLAKVNDAVTAMKKDGTLAGIYKKWFGSDPAPDSSTVQERPLPKAD